MARPDHHDRRRAESFGAIAAAYERARPSYPVALIERLTDESPGTALDVGCGTGQLTRLLVQAGWDVTGVEIDDRMAEAARATGLKVTTGRFEDVDGPERGLDLITSGQAWHWIDPALGSRKAADLLRPDGRLALVWNTYRHDPAVADAIDGVLREVQPAFRNMPVPFGLVQHDHGALDEELASDLEGMFVVASVEEFPHHREQSVAEFLDELQTHSPVVVLANRDRRELVDRLGDALSAVVVDRLTVHHVARLTVARPLSRT